MNYLHLKNSRPTIGMMTSSMASAFQESITLGAADCAKAHDCNFIVFAGGPFLNPDPVAVLRDRLFELASPELLDGLIIPMGSLSRYISREQEARFLERFTGIPIATIVSDVDGCMNITLDNDIGMIDLVHHLVKVHGIQRFALARGHENHLSSNRKMAALQEALQTCGIDFDPRMVLHSDLKKNAVIHGLEALLADEATRPQAIVSINDNQALAIIDRLQQLGWRVPEDILVTGCMAIQDGQFFDPPLTSVREPTYEMGWHAAKRIMDAMAGHYHSHDLVLPTELLIRRSCGCHTHTQPAAALSVSSAATLGDQLHRALVAEIAAAPAPLRAAFSDQAVPEILHAFRSDLAGERHGGLLAYFERQMEAQIRQEVVQLWGRLALACHHSLTQASADTRAQGIAHDLFRLTQSINEKAMQYRGYETEKTVSLVREIGIQLNSEFDVAVISRLLWRELGMNDAYLSIYDEPGNVHGTLTPVMAMQNGTLLSLPHLSYPAAQLLPPNIAPTSQTWAYLVFPLSFGTELLGILVLGLSDRRGVVYESLVTLFSAALQNQTRLREIRAAEKKFSDIAHSASDWLWELDHEGNYTYSSEGVLQVMGYTPEEVIGRSLFGFLSRHMAEGHAEHIKQTLLGEASYAGLECVLRHKAGHERVLIACGQPIIKNGRIAGFRGAFRDITEIKAQQEKIRALAYLDSLTQLPNRALFNDRLAQAVLAAGHHASQFAVLFLDLDGFKLVNDTMGHDAGDQLLTVLARRLSGCIREGDTLARFGGDEFIMVLPKIEHPEDAALVARRIVAAFAAPVEIRRQQLFITASIGIAVYPRDGETGEALLKNADKAMYKAKRQGKNRFMFYESESQENSQRTVELRNILHHGLKKQRFSLVYQPQIDTFRGHVTGVEALLRLHDPKLGAISPAEFIPLAEEIGMIEEIGLWVFDKSCAQQHQWNQAGCAIRCSVNVSALQLRDTAFADKIIAIIEQHGVDPHSLILEITENAVIDNMDTARTTLQKLTDYGLTIAIDDFGTGYASLSMLRKCPAHVVKIDRSFISECPHQNEGVGIVTAIIYMARSLGLTVVAEGVETEEQAAFLGQLECDEIQGYLYAKPMPAENVAPFVLQRQHLAG